MQDGIICASYVPHAYRGTQDKTRDTGSTCLNWSESTRIKPEDYPDAGLEDNNYCRSPYGDYSIWCYCVPGQCNSGDLNDWEYCDYEPDYTWNTEYEDLNNVLKDMLNLDGQLQSQGKLTIDPMESAWDTPPTSNQGPFDVGLLAKCNPSGSSILQTVSITL